LILLSFEGVSSPDLTVALLQSTLVPRSRLSPRLFPALTVIGRAETSGSVPTHHCNLSLVGGSAGFRCFFLNLDCHFFADFVLDLIVFFDDSLAHKASV